MPARTGGRKRRPSRRTQRRAIKRRSYRPKGLARPMRSLRTNYRGVPNQYRFVREMASEKVDLHTYLKQTTCGIMTVPGIAINDLTNFQADYANLFTNYKIDKIEVEFRPVFDVVNPQSTMPQLTLTMINTKWHINAIAYGATDAQVRQTVSQIQTKTRLNYGSKNGFKLTTYKPRMYAAVQTDFSGGTEVSSIPSRWMNISSSGDTSHIMNTDVFFERNDQGAITADTFRFLRIVRVHFRVSAVH